jgi:hypothetical protein
MLYEIVKKLNTIRSRKRPFAKWVKPEKSEDIECVKNFYNISESKAREIINLLSKEQIQQIKEQLQTGGLRK